MPDEALEPTLDAEDIQGNVLAGFNKGHQTLLGFMFGPDQASSRAFVRTLAGLTSSLAVVVAHKADRAKAARQAGTGRGIASPVVLTAAAFSFHGLGVLRPDASGFTDAEFRDGMLGSATSALGDPVDPSAPGNPVNWVVGGPAKVPDVLVIAACDLTGQLAKHVTSLVAAAEAHGLTLIYDETGHDLPHYPGAAALPSGHEHFGFKDGISQPGVRGRLPDGTPLTPRQSPAPGIPAANDDAGPQFASPGQPLVCAGEFVLGYATQQDAVPGLPGPPRPLGDTPGAIAPAWAANGSFLVFRRLRQLVGGFRAFTAASAKALARPDVDDARVAAMLVGRWPSGASVIRSPGHDDVAAAEPSVRNAFGYGAGNPALGLTDDTEGVRCPVAGHVRKVNPRDLDTDQGHASATLARRILRRGIPYGPPYLGAQADDTVDRGLFFLCYQASIIRQFEFLTSRWVNQKSLPTNPSGELGLGFDMLIGQTGSRVRSAILRFPAPDGTLTDVEIGNAELDIKDWVIPTGGGYFFAPSISAMRDTLGADQ